MQWKINKYIKEKKNCDKNYCISQVKLMCTLLDNIYGKVQTSITGKLFYNIIF